MSNRVFDVRQVKFVRRSREDFAKFLGGWERSLKREREREEERKGDREGWEE